VRRSIIIISLLTLMGGLSSEAEDKIVTPELAIPIFLKILSYDQGFTFNDTKTVDFYLPYDRANEVSYEQYRSTREYFSKNKGTSVFGARIRFIPLPYDSASQMLTQVDTTHYNLVVLTSMPSDKVRILLNKCRQHRIRTYTFDPVQVKLGVAVSIREVKGKNSIVVHLEEAEREGSRFSSQLLRICEVLEEQP
jgi:hypothetical protein